VTDIESTSVKPRQRPRPADSTVRQPQSSGVSSGSIGEPPGATSSAVVSAVAPVASADVDRKLHHPVQPQQQQNPPQDSLLLLSDQPQWPDSKQVCPPQDDMSSLIDLDPESTLLANLDPLASSVAAFPAPRQFHPSFGYSVPHANLSSSSFGRFNSPPGQTATNFTAYPPGVVPRQFLSYPMHGCSQQAIGHAPAMPYASQRMLMPQYSGVVAQGKTGSNNDLHLLQVCTELLIVFDSRYRTVKLWCSSKKMVCYCMCEQ